MQPEPTARPKRAEAEPESTECPNCHAVLPRGMRFCRACGYRLGEGLDEYVETVRLKPRVSGEARPAAGTQANSGPQINPFQPKAWGAMAAQQAADARRAAATQASSKGSKMSCAGGRKGNWWLWMIIAIVMISVVGGGLLTPFALRKRFGPGAASSTSQRSYFGTDFKTEGGGAFMDVAYPPGGPADKAGLVGGDVVINFDGQPVKSENEIIKILSATPPGKTVDVIYIRDGQSFTTKLTTITKAEYDRLDDAFDDRDKGYLKEGTDIDRVIVPGMNIYGARLNRISKSGPADIAGLKDGDIVIQFGDTPIRTRRELERRIERAEPYSTVPVVVVRDGQRMEIPVKVGIEP